MINLDIYNRPQALRVFLCKPDNSFICELNGIEPESGSIKINLNNQNELEFDYYKYMEYHGESVKSNGYEELQIGMRLFVENIGYFRIKFPPYTDDGSKEFKHITAYSIENELEDKDLVLFKINTGEESSMENLVKYEDGETEDLLNPYTGLPYDYIVFYNTFPSQLATLKANYSDGNITDPDEINEWVEYCKLIPRLISKPIKDNDGKIIAVTEYVKFNYSADGTTIESVTLTDISTRLEQLITFYTKYRKQLSLIDLAIDNAGCKWTVGDIEPSIRNKRFQFDVDGQNIYSFLTQDVASQSKCLAWFDYVYFTINYISIDSLNDDSCVILDRQALLNNINVNVNEEKIITRYNVSGGDLNLLDVNFGTNRIVNIDYYINAKNDKGNRIYVSDTLADKYEEYKSDVERARAVYTAEAKEVRQKEKDINEVVYRVPNDIVQTDWGTFKLAELNSALTQYTNLLATLKTLYKEDYPDGVDEHGEIIDNVIKGTIYWHDYYAYQQAITQINIAISVLPNGNYDDIDDAETLAQINAWETEWTLFGIKELQNKLAAYKEKMSVLLDNHSIVTDTDGTAKAWGSLTDEQRAEFQSEGSYTDARNEYNKLRTERNGCQSYLNTLQTEVDNLQTAHDAIETVMNQIKVLVTVSGYDRQALHELVDSVPNTALSFTEPEIKIITGLYTDSNYENSNILKTSIDDIVSVIDIEEELLADAKEQLSIVAQPQFTFSTNIDNVLIMPEFQGYNFNVGNYVYLQYYDDFYVKLRLDSVSFNPFAPENSINVTFTNYTTSNAQRSDLSYILKNNSSSGSSGGSGGGGGSSGDGFGSSDKIDVTLSNTMLAKLLNTEMFGSRVTDVILDTLKLNNLNARYATFGSLATGTTTIDGSCIQTGVIKSQNYNGVETGGVYPITNTKGSILELQNGKFNFGGGKLKFDGSSLTVNGAVVATTLSTGGRISKSTGVDGLFIDGDGNLYSGSANQTQINADGTFSFGGGNLTYKQVQGNMKLVLNGEINTTSGSIGGFTIDNDSIFADTIAIYSTPSDPSSDGENCGIYMSDTALHNFAKISEERVHIWSTQTESTIDFSVNGEVSDSDSSAGYASLLMRGKRLFPRIDGYRSPYISIRTDFNGSQIRVESKEYDRYTIIDNNGIETGCPEIVLHANQSNSDFTPPSEGYEAYIRSIADCIIKDGSITYYPASVEVDNTYKNGKLHVSTAGNFGLYSQDKWLIRLNADGTDAYLHGDTIRILTNSTSTYLRPNSNGGAYLGSGSYKWHSVYCSDGAFNGSDRKVKNHIEYLIDDGNLEGFIMGLKPIMYTLKSGEGKRHHMGFYAQDVSQTAHQTIGDIAAYQAIVMNRDEDGEIKEGYYNEKEDDENLSWVMNYSELIAPTVAALQKALLRIETLEAQVKELKGE